MTKSELEQELEHLRATVADLREERQRLESENNELVKSLQSRTGDILHLRQQINECLDIISRQGVLLGKLQIMVS